MRPTVRFLFSHPAHFLACGFGSGLCPKGPGTAGTLAAWLLYPILQSLIPPSGFLIFLAGAFLLGIYAAGHTGRALGVSDHGSIVWDEMVPFWLVLFLTPPTLAWQGLAFGLFRLFDIVKPPPIRWADSHIKGGFGVMFDDVLAGAYTLLVLAIFLKFPG